MQFIYAHDGIHWLQGETGALGLPDIRAQAGFVAEDGRHYYIEGSGTDSVSISLLHLLESLFYYFYALSIGTFYFHRELEHWRARCLGISCRRFE